MTQQTEHNHVKKIRRMVASGELTAEPGAMQHIDVLHDDDCTIFAGGRCNCEPDIRLRWSHAPASKNQR